MTVADLLPLYALGLLDADEVALVDRAVAADPGFATELAGLVAAAEAMIVPVAPPAHVATRLAASIGGGRLERHASRMASLFDVTVDRAREILALVERPASWELPMPGIGLVHFAGGPACATADCGFIRLAPGTTFPPHLHRGEETSVVIAGRLRDGARVLAPGDELVHAAGSADHVVACEGDEDCIYAARAFDGIEIGGVRVYVPKP